MPDEIAQNYSKAVTETVRKESRFVERDAAVQIREQYSRISILQEEIRVRQQQLKLEEETMLKVLVDTKSYGFIKIDYNRLRRF